MKQHVQQRSRFFLEMSVWKTIKLIIIGHETVNWWFLYESYENIGFGSLKIKQKQGMREGIPRTL